MSVCRPAARPRAAPPARRRHAPHHLWSPDSHGGTSEKSGRPPCPPTRSLTASRKPCAVLPIPRHCSTGSQQPLACPPGRSFPRRRRRPEMPLRFDYDDPDIAWEPLVDEVFGELTSSFLEMPKGEGFPPSRKAAKSSSAALTPSPRSRRRTCSLPSSKLPSLLSSFVASCPRPSGLRPRGQAWRWTKALRD